MATKVTKLTWKQYHEKLRNFASLLSNEEFDYIVPVARGGWVPALVISHKNKIRGVFSFGAISYDDSTNKKLPQTLLVQAPSPKELRGKKVIIVDDIVGTGRTMAVITDWLRKHKVKYKTASLFKKKGSLFVPDYFWEENKSWVKFPYE